MSLTASEISQLKQIITLAQKLLGTAEPKKAGRAGKNGAGKARSMAGPKSRRSGKELDAFRKMLKAERKAGTPVAEIAKKHGVSASYIYQLG